MYARPLPPSSNTTSPCAKQRRLRFQFGLRLLLLLVTLASVLMAWVVQRRETVARGRAAMVKLERYGAQVQYAIASDAPDEFLLIEEPPGPALLRDILGDSYFAPMVRVEFSPIGWEHNLQLRQTRRHRAQRTWLEYRHLFGDEHVWLLANFSRIDMLDLRRTKISPQGVREIRRLFPQCAIEWEPRLIPLGRFPDDGTP